MKDFSFSHRTHRSYRALLRTVSIPQKASGIQSSQSVTANDDTNKKVKSSLHPAHMGISVITPLPFGGGVGGGASCVRCCDLFLIVLSRCSFPRPFLTFPLLQYVNIFTLLKLSTCFSWFKNIPFNVREYAFLAYWRGLSCIKRGVFFITLCNYLISCELYACFFEVITSLNEVTLIELL